MPSKRKLSLAEETSSEDEFGLKKPKPGEVYDESTEDEGDETSETDGGSFAGAQVDEDSALDGLYQPPEKPDFSAIMKTLPDDVDMTMLLSRVLGIADYGVLQVDLEDIQSVRPVQDKLFGEGFAITFCDGVSQRTRSAQILRRSSCTKYFLCPFPTPVELTPAMIDKVLEEATKFASSNLQIDQIDPPIWISSVMFDISIDYMLRTNATFQDLKGFRLVFWAEMEDHPDDRVWVGVDPGQGIYSCVGEGPAKQTHFTFGK
mmetsp:Transcript_43419/g.85000  ORF Transcript_43419/g.85000 Transcript_43419/m.85000 type:complete len:261 (+) Transcript_43419:54-836(+)